MLFTVQLLSCQQTCWPKPWREWRWRMVGTCWDCTDFKPCSLCEIWLYLKCSWPLFGCFGVLGDLEIFGVVWIEGVVGSRGCVGIWCSHHLVCSHITQSSLVNIGTNWHSGGIPLCWGGGALLVPLLIYLGQWLCWFSLLIGRVLIMWLTCHL